MDNEQENNVVSEPAAAEPVNGSDFDVRPARKNGEKLYEYFRSDDEPVNDTDTNYDEAFSDEQAPEIPEFSDEQSQPPEEQADGENVPDDTPADDAPAEDTADHTTDPDPQPYDGSRDDEQRLESFRYYRGKDNRKLFVVNIVISMITLCVVAASVSLAGAYFMTQEKFLRNMSRRLTETEDLAIRSDKDKTGENEKGDDEDAVEAANIIEEEKNEPAVSYEQSVDLEKGKILIYDSYVGYGWIPIVSGIKTNSYKQSDFTVDERNRMEYRPGGEISSYFGIDVSNHQKKIDWEAVREDGVEFAILRVGFRGYGEEGVIKFDESFERNFNGAHSAGIDVGVYFYSQAVSPQEAEEEAEYVLKWLNGRKLEYPVVFDWEPAEIVNPGDVARTEDVMPQTLTLSAIAFCEKIKAGGYDAMIYTGKKLAYLKYDLRQLQNYPVWLALYSKEMSYIYDFDIWQYGFGEVDGIEGDVDYDIAIIR